MYGAFDGDSPCCPGMLQGESVTFHIDSVKQVEPATFAAPNVLCCANDLKR